MTIKTRRRNNSNVWRVRVLTILAAQVVSLESTRLMSYAELLLGQARAT
ncbi:MAG: hypothetical protein IIC02_08615 [Planctomycetes bacterium]|nr:hypothetical protein [Planctomycetota bacterium]